ncbi:hypothetical protein JSO59_002340 [Riemerella anatipestifer]|uniref:hypothetical protein n=1 Tax=Riemerella anatipestifer TaxID=34085 RepID=UPI002A88A203|nr:hypothetical protein [Riemerella anatipestifer]
MNVLVNLRYFLFALILLPTLTFPIHIYDEGVVLVNAQRIINGDMPYKDFWSIYTPGQFYMYSLFLMITDNLLVIRILECIFGVLFIDIIYRIIFQNIDNFIVSLISSALILFILVRPELRFFPPIYSVLYLCLLTAYCLSKFLKFNKKKYLYLIFSLQFFTLFFRQDIYVYSLLSLFTVFIALIVKNVLKFRIIIFPLFSFFLLNLFLLLILFSFNYFPDIIEQLLLEPLSIMPQYRKIDVGLQYYILFIFSILNLIVVFIYVFVYNDRKYYSSLYLSILCLLLSKQMFNRADIIHSMPVFICLLILLLSHIFRKIRSVRFRYGGFIIFSLSCYGIYFFFSNMKEQVQKKNEYKIDNFLVATLDKNTIDIIKYIEKHTKINDYIYVGVENHDKFLISDVILYFFFERKIPTKYTELHPGITNTKLNQEEIKKELIKTKTKYVVLSNHYWYENNKTQIDSKVNLLDDFIKNNYKEIYCNEMYRVLIINNL